MTRIKHEPWIVLLVGGLLVALAVVSVMASRVPPTLQAFPKPVPVPEQSSPMFPETPSTEVMQVSCETAGGTWNECASACRGADPATPCILLCVQQCECVDDTQCPQGYSCGAFVDDVGVCAKTE